VGWWVQVAVPKPCAKGLAPGLGIQLIPEGASFKLAPEDRHGAGASGVIMQEPRPHNKARWRRGLICVTVCVATAPSLTYPRPDQSGGGQVAADWRSVAELPPTRQPLPARPSPAPIVVFGLPPVALNDVLDTTHG